MLKAPLNTEETFISEKLGEKHFLFLMVNQEMLHYFRAFKSKPKYHCWIYSNHLLSFAYGTLKTVIPFSLHCVAAACGPDIFPSSVNYCLLHRGFSQELSHVLCKNKQERREVLAATTAPRISLSLFYVTVIFL